MNGGSLPAIGVYMLKSIRESIAYHLHDIIFLSGVFLIIGMLVYHSFYPRGFVVCEREANRLGVEFTYTSFQGCKLIEEE